MQTYYLNGPSQEGITLELSDTEKLFHLIMAFRNVRAKEKDDVQNGNIAFKVIRENNFVMMFIKMGSMKQEFIFDPTLYADRRALKIRESKLVVSLLDIANNPLRTIEVQRTIEIPQKLKDILFDAWERAFDDADYSKNYNLWYRKQQRFITNQLFERATYVGKSE